MKNDPLPFIGSHVANYALNKQVGLVLLLAEPQDTHGMTTLSCESFRNDQLQIARWMIINFLGADEEERKVKPWIEMPEWHAEISNQVSPVEKANYERIRDEIRKDAKAMRDAMWIDPLMRRFLLRLAAQIQECVAYTNRRVEAVKLCGSLATIKEDHDFEIAFRSRNSDLLEEVMRSYGNLLPGKAGLGLAYLGIKNSITAAMCFAIDLLGIVRQILPKEAAERGYAKPKVARKKARSTSA
ncbi:MAG: hypothetical protein PHC53_00500 [Patescibacteria group bacterium]|nr:hypothetical protein [Patescibacteria group bacterium]